MGLVLPGGRTLNGSSVSSPSGWTESVAWQEAGGSAPRLVAVDPFGLFTEADPEMGTGAVQDSTFQRLGSRCKATAFIKGGAGADAGVGWFVLDGLPVAPKAGEISGSAARKVGSGWILDASDGQRKHPLDLLIEPVIDSERPILNLLFAIGGSPPALDAVTMGDTDGLVQGGVPVSLAENDILNVELDFEAA